jgi:PAS domain S-box-containing protein
MNVETFDLFFARSYLCKPVLMYFHVANDLIIALAHLSILLLLIYLMRQRPNLPFQGIFWLFCAFIITGGMTHLLTALTFWYPAYWLSGLWKVITTGVSLYTAAKMLQLLPNFLVLTTQKPIEETEPDLAAKNPENLLQQALNQLENKVEESTKKLQQTIEQLENEIELRYTVEACLIEREEQYRSVVDNVKEVIFQTDTEGLWTFLNPAWSEITGFEIAESIGTPWLDYIHPEDRQSYLQLLQPLIEGKKEYSRHQLRYLTVNSDYRWMEVLVQLTYDAKGTIIGTFGTLNDITERYNSEAALKVSEATNRALLEAIPDALLLISKDGTYLDFIPAKNCQSLIAASEIKGKKIFDPAAATPLEATVLPPALARKIINDVETALKTGKVQVSEDSLRLAEVERHYESRTVFYSEDTTLVIVREVTERKLAEAALIQSEERFRSLVAHLPGVVYRCGYDVDSKVEFISDTIAEISGYPASDFLHNQIRTLGSLIAPQDSVRVHLVISECLTQKQPYALEYRIITADGSVRWVYERGQGIFDADGGLLWLDGVIFDINDYKKTQEQLQSSEEQFRQLTENINEVFFLSSPDLSQIFYISPAYERIWGRTRKSLYEQPISWLESVHPLDRDSVIASIQENFQQDTDLEQEYRILRPDGLVRWVRARAFFVLNETGQPRRIAGIVEDISKRKQAEAEILNALAKEKELSDLKSRFISLTSHEFRTPLTTILSTTELLEYYEWTKEEEVEQLHLIQDAVKQMLQMLEDLLFMGTAEAGQLKFNPEPLDIQEFCLDLVSQIQRGIVLKANPTGIQHLLSFSCPEQSILACMDKKLLRQLLSNLLLNAIKYSPSGGRILFELKSEDDYALFQIQDWGIGIPQEDQPRLFEFFHRAKNVGTIAGTGLGLAIVKTCVDLHRGQITVISDLDVGTKFTVKLPLKNQYYSSGRQLTEALTQKIPDP